MANTANWRCSPRSRASAARSCVTAPATSPHHFRALRLRPHRKIDRIIGRSDDMLITRRERVPVPDRAGTHRLPQIATQYQIISRAARSTTSSCASRPCPSSRSTRSAAQIRSRSVWPPSLRATCRSPWTSSSSSRPSTPSESEQTHPSTCRRSKADFPAHRFWRTKKGPSGRSYPCGRGCRRQHARALYLADTEDFGVAVCCAIRRIKPPKRRLPVGESRRHQSRRSRPGCSGRFGLAARVLGRVRRQRGIRLLHVSRGRARH